MATKKADEKAEDEDKAEADEKAAPEEAAVVQGTPAHAALAGAEQTPTSAATAEGGAGISTPVVPTVATDRPAGALDKKDLPYVVGNPSWKTYYEADHGVVEVTVLAQDAEGDATLQFNLVGDAAVSAFIGAPEGTELSDIAGGVSFVMSGVSYGAMVGEWTAVNNPVTQDL